MMTKKQFAKCIIAKEMGISIELLTQERLESFKNYIFSSTNVGIALETLGIIDPINDVSLYEYLQSRGGIMYTFIDNDTKEVTMLTLREILSFLPDEIKEEV